MAIQDNPSQETKTPAPEVGIQPQFTHSVWDLVHKEQSSPKSNDGASKVPEVDMKKALEQMKEIDLSKPGAAGNGIVGGADSLSAKVQREIELYKTLPKGAMKGAGNRLSEHTDEVAGEMAFGLAVGGVVGAFSKNPRILGKAAEPVVKAGVRNLGKVMTTLAAADWSLKLGAPAVQVWNDKNGLAEGKAKLAANVGGGLVDYGVGAATGYVGARGAFKFTPEYKNVPPKFELDSTKVATGKMREVKDADSFRTNREMEVKEDVAALYEKSFPLEERQPIDEVKELVQSGRILVHATRDSAGELKSFSFSSLHDKLPGDEFVNIDFIATAENMRSTGIGSLHIKRLAGTIEKEQPWAKALTLEMEHPKEAGLSDVDKATRAARAEFYNRVGGTATNVKYNILDFLDRDFRGMAEWRAFVFKPNEFDPVRAARGMYMNEEGYGMKANSKEVRELLDANQYWIAEKKLGAMAAQASAATAAAENLDVKNRK